MKLAEPVTTLTDYVLTIECLILAVLLLRENGLQIAAKFWAAAFLTTAIAAFTGGTFHGFIESLSRPGANVIWKITLYSIGLSGLFMLSAALFASFSAPTRKWLLLLALAQFVVYASWMATHDDFRYVIYDYGTAMIAILLLQFIRKTDASPWIIAGILLSFAGAAAQQTGFRAGRNWNHNDLYHFIQMIAMYVLYRGGLLLRDLR